MQWLVNSERENFTQGTILYGVDFGYEENNPLCVVLSNACDFEHPDKLSFVVLAVLDPAKETLRNSKEVCALFKNKGIESLTKKERKALHNLYTDKIHNKSIGRYYFFDPKPIIDMDPLLVDFQHVYSIDYTELKDAIESGRVQILGRMDHPYVEQMMLQFAGYMGRVPSDRLSENKIDEIIMSLLN